MNFISLEFAAFLAVLLILLCVFKDNKKQSIVLLTASYVFYAWGDYRFLILLVGMSLLMWFCGLQISRGNRPKLFLTLGICVDVGVLCLFKYLNFFAESFASLFGSDYTVLNIVLPLGISFYVFQSVSYLVDVYKQKVQAERNPLYVLLYIGFFPQIVSGPIVKAHQLLPQLHENHPVRLNNISDGAQRFLLGLFKKVVIADRLAVCVNAVYAAPDAYSSLSILLAVLTYSLQIYYDFAGYSDMAIGVGKMLGFDLGINFNLPYLAQNPSDFWKRWHISLSSWFRDYVYIPLGGSRKGKARTYLNLFITMLLSGLWHGAGWAFVLWGILHALASTVHKMYCDLKKKLFHKETKPTVCGRIIAVLLNFVCVTLLWIPFRTNDVGAAWHLITRMFSFTGGISYVYDFTLIFAALLVIVEIIACLRNGGNNPMKPLDLSKFRNKVILLCFIIVIVVFAYVGDTAFIYAQF